MTSTIQPPAWYDAARKLAEPWPDAPTIEPLVHGWTVWDEQLARLLRPALRRGGPVTVVEVGAWLAKTSLHLLTKYPSLYLVVVDVWRGHGIIHERADCAFETWQANVWPYRDRVLAIRRRSEVGMVELAKLGATPDLVYVDAAHDYGQVYLDVATACACFPGAVVCGDDYTLQVRGDELNVGHAVDRFAKRTGRGLRVDRRFWEYTP